MWCMLVDHIAVEKCGLLLLLLSGRSTGTMWRCCQRTYSRAWTTCALREWRLSFNGGLLADKTRARIYYSVTTVPSNLHNLCLNAVCNLWPCVVSGMWLLTWSTIALGNLVGDFFSSSISAALLLFKCQSQYDIMCAYSYNDTFIIVNQSRCTGAMWGVPQVFLFVTYTIRFHWNILHWRC